MCPTESFDPADGVGGRSSRRAMPLKGLARGLASGFASGFAKGLAIVMVLGAVGALPGMAPMLTVAAAAEFRSIASPVAILYDGPSVKSRKLYLAPRGMPVEVLSEVNLWVKIRDQGGDVLWVERKDLSTARTPVSAANVVLRSAPQDTAPAVVQMDRGVPLTLLDGPQTAGWLKVRLPDGSQGYVRVSDVWGA